MDLNLDIKDIGENIKKLLVKNTGDSSTNTNSSPEKKSKDITKSLGPLNNILGKYAYERETILGVELTPHYVRVCQLKESFSKWTFYNLASSCIENQFKNEDIFMNQDLYVENLKDLLAKNNIKAKDAAFTLPTSSSVIKVLKIPDMDEEDFKQAAALGSIWENYTELEGGAAQYSIYYKILRHNPAPPPIEEIPSESVVEKGGQPPIMEAEGAPDANSVTISEDLPSDAIIENPVQEIPQADVGSTDIQQPLEGEAIPADINEQIEQPQYMQAEPVAEQQPAMDQLVKTPEIPVIEGVAPGVDEIQQQMTADSMQTEMENTETPVENVAEEQVVPENVVDQAQDAEQTSVNPEPAAIEAEVASQDMPASEIPNNPDLAHVDIGITPDVGISSDINADPDVNAGIDSMVVEPAPEPQVATMDVLFIASKLADIEIYSEIIRKAGLNPVLADIRCLALKHAFESNNDNFKDVSRPFAFMEFGVDENYIFVLDGDNSDIYPVYVSDDDKNVIISDSTNEQMFEQFIQNYASQAEQILNNHRNQYNTPDINSIFITSSAPLHVDDASAAPLIKTFVRSISKIMGNRRITECDFCSHIVVPEQFAKQVNAEGNISAWAATIGAATRRLDIFDYANNDDPMNGINLLPTAAADKKNKRMSILSTLSVACVFVLFVAGIAASFMAVNSYRNALAEEINSMDGIESKYNDTLKESTRLTVFLNQVNSLGSLQESLPSNQAGILLAYKKITEVIPEGIWLEQVNFSKPNKIEVKGNALSDNSILKFVSKLNEGEEFIKMSLKQMEMEEEKRKKSDSSNALGEVKKFTIEGAVKGNISEKSLEILVGGDKR